MLYRAREGILNSHLEFTYRNDRPVIVIVRSNTEGGVASPLLLSLNGNQNFYFIIREFLTNGDAQK